MYTSETTVPESAGRTDIAALPGLRTLWGVTQGDPRIRIAVVDGPPCLQHPCFTGARLRRVQTLVGERSGRGQFSTHGTHVTSVIFGQHGKSPVMGIVPGSQGLIVPIFSDSQDGPPPQMDLARAVEQALAEGAHIINISGGQRGEQAEPILARCIRQCEQQGVLVVAATGNDGQPALHVPASLPSVLAVGALDRQRRPLAFSNWDAGSRMQGIMAPGQDILGALPGGGIGLITGTSFAAPIVAGVAALLLSLQRRQGRRPDPLAVRDILLQTATPCNPNSAMDCRRFFGGVLNIAGAHAQTVRGTVSSGPLFRLRRRQSAKQDNYR